MRIEIFDQNIETILEQNSNAYILPRINISMPMILPNGKMMTVNLRDFGEKNLDEMSDYIKDVSRRAVNTNLDEAMFEVSMKDTLKEVRRGRLHKAIFRLIGSKTGKHKVKTLKGKEKRAYLAVRASGAAQQRLGRAENQGERL